MNTHIVPFCDLSLSALEHGPIREAAEDAYDRAILAVAASLPPGDTALFADARKSIIAEALLDEAEGGGTVTVQGERMNVSQGTVRELTLGMEKKLRLLLRRREGKGEEAGAPGGGMYVLTPEYVPV